MVLEQAVTDYDPAGNVIYAISYQRFHDATGNGSLNGPNGSQPKAVRSYQRSWHDGINRVVAGANFGTNGGADLERPDVVPERSDTVLVNSNRYKGDGEANASIDPMEIETRWEDDQARRRVRLIENYDQEAAEADYSANRTTEYGYGPDGQLERLTLINSVTGNQVTRWVYGTTLSDSGVARADLLRAKIYPMSDDLEDPLGDGFDEEYERIEYEYNRLGEITKMKDPNEIVHEFDWDKLGRRTQDRVTAFGSGVDDTVKRIGTAFDNKRGLVETITSHDNATVGSGTALNQVGFAYNDFGQVTADQQEHDGTVDGSTPEVGYGFADASSGNTIRHTSMTYPDGRVIDFSYGTSGQENDLLSRVVSLQVNGEGSPFVTYTRVGLARYVEIGYPQPEVELSYLKEGSEPVGDAGDAYVGYDRFGRTVDMRWQTSSGGVMKDRFQYGYNRSSMRTWRINLVASTDQDEHYNYDGLYQITNFERGNLNINRTDIAAIPVQEEDFRYDPSGNWYSYEKRSEGSVDLSQSRSNNRDNEITLIDGSNQGIGYDKAGNATQLPPDKDGDWEKFYKLKWDAWNRLIEVRDDHDSLVAAYAYDGRFYQITKSEGATMTHYYYNDKWKCVEERNGSSAVGIQYVWGARSQHRDELVFRDRDTTGDGTFDERLFCMMDYYSATSITNTSGDVQERYGYSAFGDRTVMSAGFANRSASAFDWTFSFKGQFLDIETGYYNYGYRYYGVELGRWLSRDPIFERDSNNLYIYTMNNCPNALDRLGLETCSQPNKARLKSFELVTELGSGRKLKANDPAQSVWGFIGDLASAKKAERLAAGNEVLEWFEKLAKTSSGFTKLIGFTAGEAFRTDGFQVDAIEMEVNFDCCRCVDSQTGRYEWVELKASYRWDDFGTIPIGSDDALRLLPSYYFTVMEYAAEDLVLQCPGGLA